MSSATQSSSARTNLGEAPRAGSEVRLSVEQVSYAYSVNPSQAPLFTLEASSFQARPGEIVPVQIDAATSTTLSGELSLLASAAGR